MTGGPHIDEPPLSVSGLVKRFPGGRGVNDATFSVPRASVTGFIGANGAGKSTTLRCILGLHRPDAGQIRLFGRPADSGARRRIGFLPEERGLSPHERARTAIAFHGRLKGMGAQPALASADRLLERIGLEGRRRARIGDLSKGNAQRVQILCALVHDPDLLILDEPLTGLDPMAQSAILSLFAEHRAAGRSILFSTHAMAAAESLCDRVVMLAAGRTVFEGSTTEAGRQAPYGALVVCADADGLKAAVQSLGGDVRPLAESLGGAGRWQVTLPPNVPHPALIRALAEHKAPIFGFEPIAQGLEGAFWALASAPAAARAA